MKLTFLSHIRHYLLTGLILCATASCSDEIVTSEPTDKTTPQVGSISFRCSDMLEVFKGPDNYASRAGGSKNPEEKAIKTLHIFFFEITAEGKPGKLLQGTEYHNFQSYQKKENSSFINIPTVSAGQPPLFEGDPKEVHVVAIANIDATDDAEDSFDAKNSFKTKYNEGYIRKATRESLTDENDYIITQYSDLEEWVYYPRIRMSEDGQHGDISKLPEAGMPMIGEADIDLTDTSKKPIVNMIALMAKVNVSVKLDPDEGYFTDQYPILKITEYGVRNMPIAVPFKKPTANVNVHPNPALPENKFPNTDPKYTGPGSFAYYMGEDANSVPNYDVTKESMFHIGGSTNNADHVACDPTEHEFTTTANVTINKDSQEGAATFSYYTFENINVPNYFAERANGSDAFALTGGEYVPQYPNGITADAYQRWKSTLAYEYRASALILKGEYTTHQGLTYQAQFTIYLGKDPNTDFKVERNHQYDNNITIKGLEYIRNSTDDVYTFDGRVNVKSDNMYYLAIVNERKVDAHASALPMDIWLMDREDTDTPAPDYNTDITFDIPAEYQDWVQMVFIPRVEMESSDGRFYAGTGCEHYFYENLLTDIRNRPDVVLNGGEYVNGDTENTGYYGHVTRAVNGLQYGAQCGSSVVMRSTPEINNSRSRIYFYIDENTKNIDAEGTKDRTAIIKVKYKNYYLNNGDTTLVGKERYRTIAIQQRGVLRVHETWAGGNDKTPETFIEYYEEYLDHNDPLEEHISAEKYDGLQWGPALDGVNINGTNGFNNPESGNNYYQVYYKQGGFAMTQWAINNNRTLSLSTVKLFNTVSPVSAFHYCYGKNKRQYNGDAAVSGNVGWYMPGIRELETALVEYYNDFSDFRDNYYWSAASADRNTSATDRDDTHARATKVNISTDGGISFAQSHCPYSASILFPQNNRTAGPGYKPRSNEYLRIRSFYRRD